jgi:biopolymer transport protein ExbD
VVISADANTSHQSVVVVMDAARQLGLLRLTFAARLTSEEAQ